MSTNVLVVEDDEASRFMMSEILDELGLAFQLVVNGQECLDTLRKKPGHFDLVLMDIHMPVKTGLEALLEIRDHPTDPPKSIPVIAVSADDAWHDENRATTVGFDGVLSKPISIKRLQTILDDAPRH